LQNGFLAISIPYNFLSCRFSFIFSCIFRSLQISLIAKIYHFPSIFLANSISCKVRLSVHMLWQTVATPHCLEIGVKEIPVFLNYLNKICRRQ